jgi:hypothetical protein
VSKADTVVVVTWLLGVACIIAASGITRFNWRRDVPPYQVLDSRHWDMTLHPGKYAESRWVPLIHALNITGASLVALAACAWYVKQ